MKLEALEYVIAKIDSLTPGVAELIASNGKEDISFQVITYTEKPITLSHHVIDAIEKNDMPRAHQLSSLFLSIYYLNKEQIDCFLLEKHEAKKF